MQMQFGFQKTALLFAVAGLAACGADDENPPPAVTQVSYQSLDPVKPLTIPATLRVPFAGPGIPAVVIVHGSNGIDSRGPSYATELNKAGIATLEIDMWAPRGVVGAANRPRGVPETLPDAYGAFKYLASLPGIDAKRIGIMGFSWVAWCRC